MTFRCTFIQSCACPPQLRPRFQPTTPEPQLKWNRVHISQVCHSAKEALRILLEKEFPGFLENQKDVLWLWTKQRRTWTSARTRGGLPEPLWANCWARPRRQWLLCGAQEAEGKEVGGTEQHSCPRTVLPEGGGVSSGICPTASAV